jgi:hypothetical protein
VAPHVQNLHAAVKESTHTRVDAANLGKIEKIAAYFQSDDALKTRCTRAASGILRRGILVHAHFRKGGKCLAILEAL